MQCAQKIRDITEENGNGFAQNAENSVPEELVRLFHPQKKRESAQRAAGNRVEIFPEEETMPLFRYFQDFPMHYPDETVMEYIESSGRMGPEDAIASSDFLDLLRPEGYDRRELGYCMFPDGSGYVAAYGVRPPEITAEMEAWYRHWSNQHSVSKVRGHGNLRFKIADPADHFENHYVNGVDDTLGICFEESIDFGESGKRYSVIRHAFPLERYGLSPERMEALRQKGLRFESKGYYETFDEPGSNLCFSVCRPCPMGGTEIRSRKWIGWRPVNGRLVRDPYTKCTESHLKNVLVHMLAEREHLYTFLQALYEEYHTKPLDAD